MRYQHGETTYTVTVEQQADGRHRVTILDDAGNEHTQLLQAMTLPGGSLLLKQESGRTITYTAQDGDRRFVHLKGRALEMTVPRSDQRRGSSGVSGDLTAQMPGQVVDVLVKAGDSVESGQTLIILEAMKMEIRVSAPVEGVIKQVLVTPGDVVERGQHLIEMDAP